MTPQQCVGSLLAMAGKRESTAYMRGFGRRLEACRRAQGYETYAEFAIAAGLEIETYRLYERGLRQPKFHVLAMISEKLGKSLDFLILGKNDNA